MECEPSSSGTRAAAARMRHLVRKEGPRPALPPRSPPGRSSSGASSSPAGPPVTPRRPAGAHRAAQQAAARERKAISTMEDTRQGGRPLTGRENGAGRHACQTSPQERHRRRNFQADSATGWEGRQADAGATSSGGRRQGLGQRGGGGKYFRHPRGIPPDGQDFYYLRPHPQFLSKFLTTSVARCSSVTIGLDAGCLLRFGAFSLIGSAVPDAQCRFAGVCPYVCGADGAGYGVDGPSGRGAHVRVGFGAAEGALLGVFSDIFASSIMVEKINTPAGVCFRVFHLQS